MPRDPQPANVEMMEIFEALMEQADRFPCDGAQSPIERRAQAALSLAHPA